MKGFFRILTSLIAIVVVAIAVISLANEQAEGGVAPSKAMELSAPQNAPGDALTHVESVPSSLFRPQVRRVLFPISSASLGLIRQSTVAAPVHYIELRSSLPKPLRSVRFFVYFLCRMIC